MLKIAFVLFAILNIGRLNAQQLDTLIIFDYWEPDPQKLSFGKTGYSEDYLQIIINGKDTINLDAREHRKEIIFQHKFVFSNSDGEQNIRLNNSFNSLIKFAGLQIVKPRGENTKISIATIHKAEKEFRNKYYFDTVLNYTTIENSKLVLWNLYLFYGGFTETKNYFYPRYTLHSHNWPTPAQLARRKKVRQQIERAIVYRYNTTTRQITKS
jgi:hypothetical protein